MAVLTNNELADIRRELETWARANGVPINYVKGAVNAAAQAVEDFLTNNQAQVASDINTATAPFGVTFTTGQKKTIGAWVFYKKYVRDK